jgi:hypothetical protein
MNADSVTPKLFRVCPITQSSHTERRNHEDKCFEWEDCEGIACHAMASDSATDRILSQNAISDVIQNLFQGFHQAPDMQDAFSQNSMIRAQWLKPFPSPHYSRS